MTDDQDPTFAEATALSEADPEPTFAELLADGVTVVTEDPEPEPEPENTVHVARGAMVEITVAEDAQAVLVRRPDGVTVTVLGSGGRALYVVDQLGRYVMGGLPLTAVEVEEP